MTVQAEQLHLNSSTLQYKEKQEITVFIVNFFIVKIIFIQQQNPNPMLLLNQWMGGIIESIHMHLNTCKTAEENCKDIATTQCNRTCIIKAITISYGSRGGSKRVKHMRPSAQLHIVHYTGADLEVSLINQTVHEQPYWLCFS